MSGFFDPRPERSAALSPNGSIAFRLINAETRMILPGTARVDGAQKSARPHPRPDWKIRISGAAIAITAPDIYLRSILRV
jgi:hypothetical protein